MKSQVRRWLAAVGPLSVLFGTAASAGAAQPFSLQWRAPEGCPNADEVETEIASALAHLKGRGPLAVVTEVTLGADAPFWLRVRVTHQGQVAERLLSLANCAETSRAAALLVALSVETRSEPIAALLPPPSAKALAWSFGAGPHLVLGAAPEASAGLGVSAAVGSGVWRVSLRGAAFLPTHHTVPGSEAGGSFTLLSGGAFGCLGYPGGPLAVYGCLGGRLDHLSGTGFGASEAATLSTNIGALAASSTLEWPLTRFVRLRAEFEAGYALGQARFVIQNLGTVHEVNRLRGEAGLELVFTF